MISLLDLDIGLMERMECIRRKANEDVNAKTFCSGYIWAKPMDIRVHLEDEMYALKNSSHGVTAWNFPVGEKEAKIGFINELIHIDGLKLLKLTSKDVDFINEHYSDMFIIEAATDDSEYIYDAVEHAEMAGKRFGRLRRLLNKFEREHDTETVLLTKDNMRIAEGIMMSWGAAHEPKGALNTSGIEVDRFIIDHYDEMGLFGILVYVDGTPAAVVIGYPISTEICDIAETKTISTISDIGYVAVEEFMRMFGGTYRYFNNEEDMGIIGLREYKRCLKPCRMNDLWNAYLSPSRETVSL